MENIPPSLLTECSDLPLLESGEKGHVWQYLLSLAEDYGECKGRNAALIRATKERQGD